MIIGIDLGTTNSSCAYYDAGEAVVIPNDRGNRVTPSIVSFSQTGEVLVGETAKNQAVLNAERTVRAVKRIMGSGKTVQIGDVSHSPERISAFILSKLKRDAETYLGKTVKEAVITVPAYFTEIQRRATRKAGILAGLDVRRIINEPTAAGLACSDDLPENCTILVYDLGGGTFDVSILKKEGQLITVLATAGNNRFGGIDFDNAILNRVIAHFSESSHLDIGKDPVILQQLTDLSERAKIELSSREESTIAIPFARTGEKSIHLSYTITRDEFNGMIRPMVEKATHITLSALEDAGLSPEDLDFLVFSGGSSRIPAIRDSVLQIIPAPVAAKIHPEEIVARGAAKQAHFIKDGSTEGSLKDITPLPLGVESEGDSFYTILGKNTPIPIMMKKSFTTIANQQQAVEIHVLQGLSQKASKNKSLGKFQLYGIESAEMGVPRIDIIFAIDEDGILTVQAKDNRTGAYQDISITESETIAALPVLVARAEKLYKENRKLLDPSFALEISEILRSCKEKSISADAKKEEEYKVALETIICEIESIMHERERKDA